MPEQVYRKLAQRLNAIPNGFPSTESGAELQLLAKIFTPEQAALASVMRLTFEPSADIAARAGVDPRTTHRALKKMARQGLIRAGKGDRQLVFGLMPFAVGFYEEQLPRMDVELATLFEIYYQETQGTVLGESPSVHRVIPVQEAIPVDAEIYPYEQAVALIEQARSWGVRDCICRVQKRLIGEECHHPVENCLVFAPVEGVFVGSKVTRAITKEDALRILREAQDAGLVHSPGNYRDQNHYICNCCTCSCGILRGVAEFGIYNAVARSSFYAVVDADACAACGDCVERCQFDALSVPDVFCAVEDTRCVGCGQCVLVCPTEALRLERRPDGELPSLPADSDEWLLQRAQERGISISDVL